MNPTKIHSTPGSLSPLSKRRASAYATRLQAEDEDGWTYKPVLTWACTIMSGDWYAVKVWDEEGNFLGYLTY
jgi:hypothetical protein